MKTLTLLISIGGPTCSGKTLLVKSLKKILPEGDCFIVHQDDYAPVSHGRRIASFFCARHRLVSSLPLHFTLRTPLERFSLPSSDLIIFLLECFAQHT